MAPSFASSAEHLVKRYTCYYYYSDDECHSNWYDWGRWVVLAVVLVVAFVVFLGLACISSRRRRRRGATPMYGTGWMATNTPGQAPNYNQPYYGQGQQQPYQSQYQAAPAYDAQGQQTGQAQGYYGGAQGYYGQGVQSPANAYQPGYAPPPGAPPKA